MPRGYDRTGSDPAGQLGLGDHVLHGRIVEAVAQEAPPGGVEDLLAAGGEVSF